MNSRNKRIINRWSINNVISQIVSSSNRERNIAFICTVIMGIIIHFQYLSNNFINEDTVKLQVYADRIWNFWEQGRWAAPLVSSRIISPYLVQSLIGFLSILWIALFSMGIIEILGIKRKATIFLISGLFISFPTLSYASGYLSFFPTLTASIFFGMLTVFIVEKVQGKIGIVLGGFVLMFSLAIYQQSLGTTMMVCILVLLSNILKDNLENKELIKKITRFLLVGILGGVLYCISIKITGLHIPISAYKGLNSIGSVKMIQEMPNLLLKAYKSFVLFFLGKKFFQVSDTIKFCYLLLGLLGLYNIIILCIKNGVLKNKVKLFITIALCIVIPICVNIIDVFSIDSDSYTLTVYNMVLVLTLFIILLDIRLTNYKREHTLKINILEWSMSILILIIIFSYIRIDNIYYLKMHTYTERSFALSNRILTRMEEIPGFRADMKVVVLGSLPNNEYPSVANQFPEIRDDVGLRNAFVGYPPTTSYVSNTKKFLSTMNQRFGMNFEYPTQSDFDAIESAEEYLTMDIWPKEGSIKIINDTMVVNLKYPVKVKATYEQENNSINFELENLKVLPEGCKFAFKLYTNYTTVLETTKYSKNTNFNLKLDEPGVYSARVYIKNEEGLTIESAIVSEYIKIGRID